MKMLFVIPKNKSLYGGESLTNYPHTGVAYLSAFLRSYGVEIQIFDDGIEPDRLKLFHVIDEYDPDLIGLTAYAYNYDYACDLSKIIKSKYSIPLVIGGVHVSSAKKEAIKGNDIEFAIKHEGEYSLLELLTELSNKGNDYKRIKGLIWKDHSGEIVENSDRPYVKDIDSLPFPDYENFDLKKYNYYNKRTLPIISSRGCPYKCNYCSVKLSMGTEFRARSAKKVVEEIESYYHKGWANFEINDDCFTLNIKRAEGICDLILEKKLKITFQFLNGIRADMVTPQLLVKMKHAGCTYISYGCETGSERVLKIIKKGIDLQKVRNAVKWTNEAKITNSVNFMIGHTEETYEDALETVRFAKFLPANYVNFYNHIPFPGTEAFNWVREKAILVSSWADSLNNITTIKDDPIFETKEFTKGQREMVLKIGRNLHDKQYMCFKFGRILGSFIYAVTRIDAINQFLARFVLDTQTGNKFLFMIYILASKIRGIFAHDTK